MYALFTCFCNSDWAYYEKGCDDEDYSRVCMGNWTIWTSWATCACCPQDLWIRGRRNLEQKSEKLDLKINTEDFKVKSYNGTNIGCRKRRSWRVQECCYFGSIVSNSRTNEQIQTRLKTAKLDWSTQLSRRINLRFLIRILYSSYELWNYLWNYLVMFSKLGKSQEEQIKQHRPVKQIFMMYFRHTWTMLIIMMN